MYDSEQINTDDRRMPETVLHEFLTTHRAELIERCRLNVAGRLAPRMVQPGLLHGIPTLLDQLITTLQAEQDAQPTSSQRVSGLAGGGPAASEIGAAAALHGHELLQQGFTIEQVVHDYGDLCQAITDLALQHNLPIAVAEFRTLNRCLDNGIADAVSEYAFQRNSLQEIKDISSLNERLGSLAHELRNLVQTATLAVMAIKAGNVGLAGPTAGILDRSLAGLRNLIDRSLADVRLTAGMPEPLQSISLADFVADVVIVAALEAQAKGCTFTVSSIDTDLAVHVDRQSLFTAVMNLLQNAFKFTGYGTEVSLSAYAVGERIRIDIADHCGGLPAGSTAVIFRPFAQSGEDRSGVGLGLAISRRNVEASKGVLSVRDVAGVGCVFTIDLPRYAVARTSWIRGLTASA